jgi:hypothetical protein
MPLSLVSSLFWLKDLITARAFSSSSYAQLRLATYFGLVEATQYLYDMHLIEHRNELPSLGTDNH